MSDEKLNNGQGAARAELYAALIAASLTVLKTSLFFFSGSLIIALSAWDSAMDSVVSLMNRKIVKYARVDADDNHPYGHGRAESIASLGQGCLIVGGTVAIMISAFNQLVKLYNTNLWAHKSFPIYYSLFFLFCAVVSFFLTKWLVAKGTEYNSPALLGDSMHYQVDSISNVSSACAVGVIYFFPYEIVDPIIAILFSIFIIVSAFKIVLSGFNELMDYDIPEDVKQKALKIINSVSTEIVDVHNFRGRKSGHRYFFDFHLTLPHTLTFNEVHDIIEKIEFELYKNFDGDVIIHPDPSNIRPNSK